MTDSLKGLFYLSAIFAVCFLITTGCGEKGPPLPPIDKTHNLAAVYDLRYSLLDSVVTLTWQHKTDDKTARIKPEAFEVFMAKKGPDDCETCPFEFNREATVTMPRRWYTRSLEKGIKYYFRVQAVGEDYVKSDYSKTVQVGF